MRRGPFQLEPGKAIDRYELLVPIAKNRRSQLWAACSSDPVGNEEVVALRALTNPAFGSKEDEHRWQLEARLASRIRHPHVARYLDLVEDEGLLGMSVEWIDGRTLDHVLRRLAGEPPISIETAVRIIAQACTGLRAMHELRGPGGKPLGFVHCEVSPRNLMLDLTGMVKVVDFGIARSRPWRGQSGKKEVVEPSFAAPELVRGERVDARADVFSLGAILYLLTTGRHPFASTGRAAPSASATHGAAVASPSELVSGYPPALERVVLCAIELRREDRFRSTTEMLSELIAVAPGSTSKAPLAELARRVCGDSVSERRASVQRALQSRSMARAKCVAKTTPAGDVSGDTLSPSYVAMPARDARDASRWNSGRMVLIASAAAFVVAFAGNVGLLLSSRMPSSVPAARAPKPPEPWSTVAQPAATPTLMISAAKSPATDPPPLAPKAEMPRPPSAPARKARRVTLPSSKPGEKQPPDTVLRRYGI